jgi:tetratricopeptide (TPR) repeat protein
MPSRLEQLEQFYREDPHDPFNLYGLALEYLKIEPARAKELFEILLDRHADYIPTYYHAAKLFIDMNERERAIEIYEKGIERARSSNADKALRELRSAYDELMFE